MKRAPGAIMQNEIHLTVAEFLKSYNTNIPQGYPRATMALLDQFKAEHLSLFKIEDVWTLDHHRKRLIDWLPQNIVRPL